MDQILLVEDDTAMAESLVYALEAEQFAVRHARTWIKRRKTAREWI